jgi:anti-repressor protein
MSNLIKNFVFFAKDPNQIDEEDDTNSIVNIRTVIDSNNEPYFVASDIASALGYKNTNQAINDNCFNPITYKEFINSLQTLGKAYLADTPIEINNLQMQTKLIREPDVYALIFRSKLESAKRFQLWVFEEVLPSIRKTGKYSVNSQFNGNDLTEISKSIVLLLEENITIKKQLSFVIDELIGLKPKAEAFDLIVENKDAYSMEEAAKLLNQQFKHLNLKYLSRNTLLDCLRKAGVVNYKNIAYQKHINSGNFMYKYSEIVDVQGKSKQVVSSTLITPNGLNYCIGILKQHNILPTVLYPTLSKHIVVPTVPAHITLQ